MSETNLIWVEFDTLLSSITIKPHSHDYCHLFYVSDGCCNFSVNNERFRIDAGNLIIAVPGQIHQLEVTTSTAKVYELKFSAENDILRCLSKMVYPVKADVHSDFLLRSIVKNGRSRLTYYKTLSLQYLKTLLIHLTEPLHEIQTSTANSQLIDTEGFSKVSIDIIIFLEENYSKPLSLDLIADTLGFNKHYICTAFKKDVGITIINYLNYLRIRHAAELFSYSDSDPLIICNKVGFKNLSHFNHTFKYLTGMPPGHYRKMFPVDVNGNLKEGNFLSSSIDEEIKKASEVIGLLNIDNEKGSGAKNI